MRTNNDPYRKYGLRRVVNAAVSLTVLGGSIPDQKVFRAMEDASKAFIRIPELQSWAGKQIAKVTGAEAGLPTSGATNAIILATAACIMRGTELENYNPLEPETWGHLISKLPLHTEGLKTEFIVQKSNRNRYDHAVECAGGRILEVGGEQGATEDELDRAFSPEKTAAYYFTARTFNRRLPLETVAKIAHKNGVPVIVDGAPDLPPREKLREYINKGADLVVFSGGKHLAGPNNSGILAGRKDLIKLAHLQAYPFHGIGRAAKMSRETIVGLVTAIQIYTERDEKAHFKNLEEKANLMASRLGAIPGVKAGVLIQKTVEHDLPMSPLSYIKIDEEAVGITLKEVHRKLKEGDPSIEALCEPAFLIRDYHEKITFNPEYLLEGDDELIIDRVKKILTTK